MDNIKFLEIKEFFLTKQHHKFRKEVSVDLVGEYSSSGFSCAERVTRRFEFLCKEETPVVLSGEKIAFLRTINNLPPIYSDAEMSEIRKEHYIHELGFISNVTPDYAKVLSNGLLALREGASEYTRREIDALLDLS
ncbi:MAG: hypothetical protein J5903_03670, partial [Clostridia bacterium]|nr:hypothetical protein [Clostridia bacterium]